ncbi:MAG: fibronectin type III domain-containing protein [Bacteroides sp.]|nr:fibronectin type III domain-containing protein [Bacteroides sp.]
MNISTFLKCTMPAAALCLGAASYAGNIPQYAFTETREGFEFKFLGSEATTVKNIFGTASEMVFPERQTLLPYSGQGFPIGFDFRYGGKTFNQFAINNNGYLLLGNDRIEFRGYCNMFFGNTKLYSSNSFYLGLGPALHGIKEGDISYLVEGTEGNRTLTVQFAHMGVNEASSRGNAVYSLQIVLCEKDGTVKFNFIEEETPYTDFKLIAGLAGWSVEDDLILASEGLDSPAHVAPGHIADMLIPDSHLNWSARDILGDGHMDPYAFCFTFTPTGAPGFSCASPGDLTVDQVGDTATVSCTRPADAPATVILFSEHPILDLPQQGVTYPVANDAGDYLTTFGDATMIYYSNGENPTATFSGLKPSTRYYVKAFGVNGYPYYSYDSSADLEFVSSHPAPYVMQASTSGRAIDLKTLGEDPLIIAVTLDRVNTSNEGATGIFGFPEADVKAGDEIEGGGTVIYVGDPGDFTYADATPNRQNFFRAWAVRDGHVSKTFINASGVTDPVMPYEPMLEYYTLYESPLGWNTQTTNTSTEVNTIFMPRMRGVDEDQPVVGAVSAQGTTSTLTSPEITFGANAKISFEWAMETVRDVSDMGDAMVVLPEGNIPGVFGAGHSFKVTCGRRGTENTVFTATEYTGKMTSSPSEPDRYISGTSEFLPVEAALPADLDSARITFSFSTEGFSYFYLRNIVVTGDAGVQEVFGADGGSDIISAGEGSLTILSALGGRYTVYSLDGRAQASVNVGAGEGCVVALPAGIYAVAGRKVIVK